MIPSADELRLSDVHRRQVVEAGRRQRAIRRAVSFARLSAWTTALFAALTLAFSLFGLVNLILGTGLALVAANEFRGAVLLQRLDLHAPLRLAAGQLGLGLLIVGYCLWGMTRAASGGLAQTGDPQIQEMIAEYQGMVQGLAILVYGVAIGATVLFQGSAAVFYLTRKGHVRRYLQATPQWVVEIDRLRAGERTRQAA